MTPQRDASSDVIRHRFHHNASHKENEEGRPVRALALVPGFKGMICEVRNDEMPKMTINFFK